MDLMGMMSGVAELSARGNSERKREMWRMGGRDGRRGMMTVCKRCSAVTSRSIYDRDECKNCGQPLCLGCGAVDIVHDHVSGNEVCANCGIVIRQILLPTTVTTVTTKSPEHAPPGPLKPACGHRLSTQREVLVDLKKSSRESAYLDLCDAAMLNDKVAARASQEFMRFRAMAKSEKISDKNLMAYAIYYAAIVEGSPRSPLEIAARTGVTKSILCDIEGVFPLPLDTLAPDSYIPTFFPHLGLGDTRHQMAIERLCRGLTCVDAYDPKTVAATIIYIYCRDPRTILEQGVSRPTMKEIGRVCGVSASSISRCAIIVHEELDQPRCS